MSVEALKREWRGLARPLSEEKRQAILDAAIRVFAVEGTGAPTAKIARAAGVADGTLFVYFKTKDELLNCLYLHIKAEIAAMILDGYPSGSDVRDRLEHVWRRYIAWSLDHLEMKSVLTLLMASPQINRDTMASSQEPIKAFEDMMHDAIAADTRIVPTFAAAVMTAFADVTIKFITAMPTQREHHMDIGFAMLAGALSLRE